MVDSRGEASANFTHSRISTGYARLDEALRGGFLHSSSVILSAPPGDEVPIILGKFLTESSHERKQALLISRSLSSAQAVAPTDAEQVRFLVCEAIPSSKSVIGGGSVGNLTALNLQVSEALRAYQPSRLVIDILSDVLLRHKLVQTRKWLGELLSRFRSQGITTIAHINPKIHPLEEVDGLIDLFDGHLEIVEAKVDGRPRKWLRINWIHGIEVTEREFPLVGLVAEAPPAEGKRIISAPHNFPIPPTPLIGREKELPQARQLLLRDDVRILTMTGSGGTGKTRLASELAPNLLNDFRDGVFFVQLAAINDPKLVAATIAGTLGLKEEAGRTLMESLKLYLQEKSMLLLLDNFEQIFSAAPMIAELIAHSPRVKVLVTSRSALRLRGEFEFPVEPLAVPSLKRLPQVESLSQYPAVALFVERAKAVNPDFRLTNENARAVAEICIRLDGLPLALELAASRIKLLAPSAMLPHLEKRLELLTRGAQDLPARQQTLRAAIDWSYDLLNEGEKTWFRRLSVFVGGCTIQAAEAVCTATADLDLQALDPLSSLVDKSLLSQKANGESRFSMLETIREYALERLAVSGEEPAVRRQHADFFVALAEEAESELLGPQQSAWLERLEREHGNLRAALRWSADSGEAIRGLHLAGALWRFWYTRGYLTEGRQWLEEALARAAMPTPARAKALNGAGALALTQGDYRVAHAFYDEALAIFRQVEDKGGVAASLNNLALIANDLGDLANARALYEESLTLSRELKDKPNIAHLLNNLGLMAQQRGSFAEARSLLEQSLMIKRELGDKRGIAATLLNLGNVARDLEDYRNAGSLFEESLGLFRELGEARGIAYSMNNLGLVAYGQGDYGRAANLLGESLALFRELGDKLGLGVCLEGLAGLAAAQADYERAKTLYDETLAVRMEIGDREGVAGCLEGLAALSCTQRSPERAARLFGAAEALRENIGYPIPPADLSDYKHNVASARAALGEQIFAAAWSEGRAMIMDQAIAYALGDKTTSQVPESSEKLGEDSEKIIGANDN